MSELRLTRPGPLVQGYYPTQPYSLDQAAGLATWPSIVVQPNTTVRAAALCSARPRRAPGCTALTLPGCAGGVQQHRYAVGPLPGAHAGPSRQADCALSPQ